MITKRITKRQSPSSSSSSSTVPAPFVFPQTDSWAGNDGDWSVFSIHVGTPGQDFKVHVSTESPEVWVPLPEGCTDDDLPNCPQLRGAQPFNGAASEGYLVNASSTWEFIGLYGLDLKMNLDYSGNGQYGYDTVGFGAAQDSDGLEVEEQVIAGIADKDYFMGHVGLGVQPTSFSSGSLPVPSMMQRLLDQNKIPSLSYSYTAGASYRQKKVPGSLILGGYDSNRVTPSENPFTFASTDDSGLRVGVQSISGRNTLDDVASFTSSGYLSLIDSTVPHLWLPRDVCDRFESAFGLTYDEDTDLYLVNDTVRSRLQELEPEITFRIGNDPFNTTSETTVNVVFPYAAFDLEAGWPIYDEATPYFPIRRAANDSQYTLGRTFLQEAFLIVDYERENFTVAQASFPDPMPEPQVVAITNATLDDNGDGSGSDDDLGGGAIAGIVIGSIAGVAVLALALWLLFRQHRRRRQQQLQELHGEDKPLDRKELPLQEPVAHREELDSTVVSEAPSPGPFKDGTPAMLGIETRVQEAQELPADEVVRMDDTNSSIQRESGIYHP